MDFKMEISRLLAKLAPLEVGEIYGLMETPPDAALGDYAFPCFRLAGAMRKNPAAIAAELKDVLLTGGLPPYLGEVYNEKAYLNFRLDAPALAGAAVGGVLERGVSYGASGTGGGRVVCIDYSSINIAKRFHIGHLMTTVIGNSLKNIYNFLGYKCVGINHLGDWGTQFGKLISAYLRWGSEERLSERGIEELEELYVRFHKYEEEHPEIGDEGRMWFKRIEDGDQEALALFERFKALTMKYAESIYALLGVSFESYAGESFYNDKTAEVVEQLREKGLLSESEGAQVVFLEEFGLPPALILKSDGSTLYITRDIAAALYRKRTYDFDKALYVVASHQNLHFQQLFHTLEKMGYNWGANMEHISYGMVSLEDGPLSTRLGRMVYLNELLERAIEKTTEVMREKSPDMADMETAAKQVGVGAVVFGALYNSRVKDVVFSWDKALNFDGETGPYVQYTHARCCSVLKKAGELKLEAVDYTALSDAHAQAVARLLLDFPQAVVQAAERYEPFLVTRHIVRLAQSYNRFYYENRILDDDEGVKNARLALTLAVKTVIATGLSLIGVEAPEQM